jgi:anti-sigma regulatory factor (Ser/Thr protein kinase)
VSGAPFQFVLPRSVDGPGVGRRLLADWFAPALGNGTLVTARLLVSELVSNAVRHGSGRITLRAQLSDRCLLVEVIDEGQGFEPELPEPDVDGSGAGRWGLSIVAAESSRWGIGRGTTHVWFELDRPEPRLEATGE